MFDVGKELAALERGLEQALEQLDRDVLDPGVARELIEEFCRMERLCAAGKAALAGGREEPRGQTAGNDHGSVLQVPPATVHGPNPRRPRRGGER